MERDLDSDLDDIVWPSIVCKLSIVNCMMCRERKRLSELHMVWCVVLCTNEVERRSNDAHFSKCRFYILFSSTRLEAQN